MQVAKSGIMIKTQLLEKFQEFLKEFQLNNNSKLMFNFLNLYLDLSAKY